MFDGAGTIVKVVAVSQHVHDLPVPQQCDVVPCLGLPGGGEEEEEELWMSPSKPGTLLLEQRGRCTVVLRRAELHQASSTTTKGPQNPI